jgi:hypothetical protein
VFVSRLKPSLLSLQLNLERSRLAHYEDRVLDNMRKLYLGDLFSSVEQSIVVADESALLSSFQIDSASRRSRRESRRGPSVLSHADWIGLASTDVGVKSQTRNLEPEQEIIIPSSKGIIV